MSQTNGAYGLEYDVRNGRVQGIWLKNGRYVAPYKPSKYGGWDKCSGEYTPKQMTKKLYNHDIYLPGPGGTSDPSSYLYDKFVYG